MDSIAVATEAADEGWQHPATPEARHRGPDDPAAADRLRADATSPGHGGAAQDPLLDAPPPDAVVTVSLRQADAQETRTREAALRARHAAEVARLRAALRAMEEAHAAEVARLRAEHAADTAGLRRAVEADPHALEEALAGAERPSDSGRGGGPGLKATRSAVRQRATIRKRLARLTGRGGGDPMGPWGQPAAKPSVGADLIAAVRALRPTGAAAISRLRGTVPPPH
jgi:hypothetical protein